MRTVGALLALSLVACATTASPQPLVAPQIEEMMAVDRQFDADTAAEGAEGWVKHFTPNGVMLLGTAPAIAGHEAIRTAMQGALSRPGASLRWQPTGGEVLVPGVLGYTVGRYESVHHAEDGRPVVSTGTYVSVWRKQEDGTWKAVFDTGAPDPGPGPDPGPKTQPAADPETPPAE